MVVGNNRKLYQKWRFILRIDGIEGEAGWGKAGPLEVENAVVEYHSGGAMIPHKEPGRATFPPITCERGSTNDDVLYDWLLQVTDAAADRGSSQVDFKRNMTLEQLNREGEVVKLHRIFNAWPSKFTSGDWDGNTDEVNLEVLEITFDYFETENVE